jgi:predicted GH43/DUF377 family glycosyl hydrolase
MLIELKQNSFRFTADPTLVIPLFRNLSDEENLRIIKGILELSDKEVDEVLAVVVRSLPGRYRNITSLFEKHFEQVNPFIKQAGSDPESLSDSRKSLLGAAFTFDFPVEAAGLFSPSVAFHPDQTELNSGEKRLIFVLRAIGPGHKSSLVFRSGVIDRNNQFTPEPSGKLLSAGEVVFPESYSKERFVKKLHCLNGKYEDRFYDRLFTRLQDTFTASQLKSELEALVEAHQIPESFFIEVEQALETSFELDFSIDAGLSEKIIYPFSEKEKKGYKSPVLVKFGTPQNDPCYMGTCIADSGSGLRYKLFTTSDFYHFEFSNLFLDDEQLSHPALFPVKFNGKYALLASKRNGIYLAFSSDLNHWGDFVCIYEAHHAWELVKLTHSGAPLHTPQGWLIITQGTGPGGKTTLSALLFDKDNPAKMVAALNEPLLTSTYGDGLLQFGQVSGGAILHNETLIVPFSITRFNSTYAEISLEVLMKHMVAVPDLKRR